MTDAWIFEKLYLIRRVEEEIARVYPTDKIKSPVHLSIGQEAASVGACSALVRGDRAFGTYRGHALYLALGGNLKRFVAELYGKATGCAKGKGGSMHLIEPNVGLLGTSAVVGSTIPHAVGAAYAAQLRGEPRIVASFFGDGATEEGAFYESLNFAVLKNLPVLFVCENNLYAIHSPILTRQSAPILARATGFGLWCDFVENGDVFAVAELASNMVESIRSGHGPCFLEVGSYRWMEHVGPGEDFDAGYRTRQEAGRWKALDPLASASARLDDTDRASIEQRVEQEIRDAFQFAEESPEPAPEELYSDMPT